MRRIMLSGLLAMVAAASLAVRADDVVTTANKKTYRGEILDINDDGVKIKDSKQGMTLLVKWENMSLASIKEYNEDLYKKKIEERKAEFEKQKAELGLVKYTTKEGKEIFVTPAKKTELENKAKGLELYKGEWLPTNKVEELKYEVEMKRQGKVKFEGKWYNAEEVKDVELFKKNKGLRIGMKGDEVKKVWGEPTEVRKSSEFASRKREMWIYVNEEKSTEDRVIMEQDAVLKIQVNQESDY